jgi:hypothetical protein
MGVVAIAVLALVFRLAALGLPTPPGLADGDAEGSNGIDTHADTGLDGTPAERSVAAPGVPTETRGSGRAVGAPERTDDSSLTKLASALQENVRQQVWGKAWERIRDQLARSVGGDVATTSDDGNARTSDDDDGEQGDGSELARASGDAAPHRRSPSHAPAAHDATSGSTADESPKTNPTDDDDSEAHDGGGSGAGSGTSPSDLFGGAPVATGAGGGSFELSLAARMKGDHLGRRGGAPAPDADPDARPALATERRRESAAHRMAVPAAYEQVVREVFAHREEP